VGEIKLTSGGHCERFGGILSPVVDFSSPALEWESIHLWVRLGKLVWFLAVYFYSNNRRERYEVSRQTVEVTSCSDGF
jgi:hypothetical protein